MRHAPPVLETIGFVCFVYGCALLAAWLGWMAAGTLLIAAALHVEERL